MVNARHDLRIKGYPVVFIKSLIAIFHSVDVSYAIRVPQALNRLLITKKKGKNQRNTSTNSRMTELSPGQMPPQVAIATVTSAEL